MKTKAVITDGGVVAQFTCSCGHSFKVSIWGMVYIYTPKGQIIKPRKFYRNVRKCKCGKKYIFAAIPDIVYKNIE